MPGMDGTACLFGPFQEALDSISFPHQLIAYPTEYPLGYEELQALVLKQLPDGEEFLLVAESFSGPLALRLASERPRGLVGVVLVASFVRPPLPLPAPVSACLGFAAAWLAPLLFHWPPPRWAQRLLLLGCDASDEEVRWLSAAIAVVRPSVFGRRISEIMSVDVRQHLKDCPVPLLYLQASRDNLVQATCARTITQIHSGIPLVKLAGPHLLLQRAPAASAEAIRRWWASRSSAGAEGGAGAR